MKLHKSKIYIFTFIFLLILISYSISTTILKLSLKNICENSSEIVIAKVLSLSSYSKSNENRIYTDIILKVEENIKGSLNSNENIKLTIYGGTVNGITTIMLGGPRFIPGELTLLFFERVKDHIDIKKDLVITGLSQGKFEIIKDEKTSVKMVFRSQIDEPLLLEKNGITIPINRSNAIPLSEFLIKSIILCKKEKGEKLPYPS